MATLNQILILFLLLLAGYLSKKFKVISNDMNKDVSNLILFVTLPAMMITSLSSYDFSKEMLIKSGKLIVISWGVYALSIALSYLIPKLLKIEGTKRDIFQFLVVFSNVGFMGYPVANAVFGSEGVFYAALYNLPFNILIWTFGIMVMSRPAREESDSAIGESSSFDFKVLLNPGIVAVFLGFTMFLTSTKLPGPIFEFMDMLGSITTPLSMIFVGSTLADMDTKSIFTGKDAFIGSAIRLVILPLIVYGVLKQFNFDSIMIGIPVVITAMPVAANCTIMAAKYGNDYKFASQTIFISTLLSMLTIPWIVSLL